MKTSSLAAIKVLSGTESANVWYINFLEY